MYGAFYYDHHTQKFQQIVEHQLGKLKPKVEANGNDLIYVLFRSYKFCFVIVQWRRVDACLEYNSMI